MIRNSIREPLLEIISLVISQMVNKLRTIIHSNNLEIKLNLEIGRYVILIIIFQD